MNTRSELRGLVTALCTALLGSTTAGAQVIHYVRTGATGAGDGTSWADAFVELQPALGVAQGGSQIWVAEGTYTPAEGGLDRNAMFTIPSAVGVFGGFTGTELTLTQREPSVHVTELSGDLLGDDALGESHWIDNSYQILMADATVSGTVLDGFVVRGGHADLGGLLTQPGGLHAKQATIVVRDCRFEDNSAESIGAGAIRCSGGQAHVTITGCTFVGNRGTGSGGAIGTNKYAKVDIRNCGFFGNSSAAGAAINLVESTATISGCIFSGNHSSSGGGAIEVSFNAATISDCTFSGNTTASIWLSGGAVLIQFDAAVTISNSVLWGNEAAVKSAGQDEISLDGTLLLDHCTMEAWSFQFAGNNVSGLDPKFVDPDGADDMLGTDDDDFALLPGSPCIDSGTNAGIPEDTLDADCDGDTLEADPLDARDVSRFNDDPDSSDIVGQVAPVVDRGAYEFSRWTNLGHGLGDEKSPCLIGFGSWKPGLPLGISITGAKPNTFGLLFLGTYAIDAPFKGGIMVPHPLFLIGITTDASGQLSAQGLLPANAPPGFETFIQAWFVDASGPKGVTSTNAVSGKTP